MNFSWARSSSISLAFLTASESGFYKAQHTATLKQTDCENGDHGARSWIPEFHHEGVHVCISCQCHTSISGAAAAGTLCSLGSAWTDILLENAAP